ncbi:MAG: hypothetical protein ABIT36_06825 [Steroidobacteraceae bacterium]
MLKLILIITLGVPNVAEMERAYSTWLDYSRTGQGQVSRELAAAWDAPRMEGRDYVLMQPASRADIYLRFVQVDAAPGYVPMKTSGWNAIESLVQDPDALAKKLAANGSPFKIAGVPRPLGPGSTTRAMQAIGPAQEVLYLTNLPAGPGRSPAVTFVDRPFIMVLGGTQIDDMLNFYKLNFGLKVSETPSKGRITVLNKAYGLDLDTTHPMGMARVSPQYSIEIDGYPAEATARPTKNGELPPAIAMVGFEVDSLDGLKAPLMAPPRNIASAPYNGRRVAVVRGGAGELIELIESKK